MEYIIRKKELKDCEDWINVNISSWNDNLKGIVSDKLLEKIAFNKEERIKKEKEIFKQDDNHYVLEENNKIVGILKIKKSDRNDFKLYGEVQVLYLLSSALNFFPFSCLFKLFSLSLKSFNTFPSNIFIFLLIGLFLLAVIPLNCLNPSCIISLS